MASPHLTDSNIFLRLLKVDDPQYSVVRSAVTILRQRDTPLFYTLQNIAEFWSVATRPRERNGFGLSTAQADEAVREIEKTLTLLPDTALVYRAWRRLVVEHDVHGVKVHDAHLVATMRAYGLRHLLTLNEADFRRYPDVIVVTPAMLVEAGA